MRAQSITVLGGTGFLGTRLVARLIKDGHQVTVLSRDREQHKHLLVLPGLTLKNCDVYNEAQLSETSAEITAATANYDYLSRRAELDYAAGLLN